MRQKQLIAPELPSLDRSQYKLQPSFSRIFDFCGSIFVLEVFIIEIITPGFSIVPIANVLTLLAFISVSVSLISFLVTYVIFKISKYIINSSGLVGVNYALKRSISHWQDISSVKSFHFCGLRSFAIIKHPAQRMKNIHILSLFLYELTPILSRVREYAGKEHPLTIALEKEVSLPRQHPARTLWRIIAGISIVLSVWLVGGNLYAEYREQPLNQEISSYVRQHPKTAPNQSAIDLQASMTKLGLSYERFGDGSKVQVTPTKDSVAEWQKIDKILDEYITKQLHKSSDSFDRPPVKLHDYLNTHRLDIETIQNTLINHDLPYWGSDSSWLNRVNYQTVYDNQSLEHRNPFSLVSLQKILVADYLDSIPLPTSESHRKSQAILKFNQSSQNNKDFLHQLTDFINERNGGIVVRSVDLLSDQWNKNLPNKNHDKIMQAAIEYELMSSSRYARDPKILEMTYNEMGQKYKIPFFFILKYYHLARPYTRVMAVDIYQKNQQNLAYWVGENICLSKGDNYLENPDNVIDTPIFSRQYIKVKTSDLDRELTQGIRQIKSELSAGQQIDTVAIGFKLGSKTCPGEQWTAKVKDGGVEVAFSHPPNWKALGMDEKNNIDRFTYLIKSKANQAS